MSIGLDFILRAKTAGFTGGIAAAEAGVKGLKRSLKDFDVGNGFKQALGVGGVIAGFRLAITSAQELRDEAKKTGAAIDDSTRSVASYGDSLDTLWKNTKELTITTLSFFTRAGEGWGMLINRIRGVSKAQEEVTGKIGSDSAKQLAARDALVAKNRDPEIAKQLDKQIADQERQNGLTGISIDERRNKLLAERTALWEQIDKLQDGNIKKEKELAASKLTGEITGLGQQIFAREDTKRDKEAMERKKTEKALIDKFAPSVEELAKQDVGTGVSGTDARLRARQALKQEDLARTLFERGDAKGGLAAAQKAAGIRTALENRSSETGALTPKAAEDAFTNALKDTNTKLDDLEKAVSGIIKAQK